MDERKPKVIHSKDALSIEPPGGAYGKRMISSSVSEKMGMGILYVDRGKSPHRWHTHNKPDRSGGYEIHYPEGFEETYLVVQGEGVIQWKEKEEVYEEEVRTGDAVWFPAGVGEHQLLNNCDRPMIVVYAFTPAVGTTK